MTDMIRYNEKAPRRLGLYIHIPFCRTKCLYCDFCSFVSRSDGEREAYVDALCLEIERRKSTEYLVDTIYFGGGTPSLLSVEQIGRILSAVRENFVLDECAEITLECNPTVERRVVEDADPYEVGKYFKELRELGVNRLSIGVQSTNDTELKLIGRRHTFYEAKQTFFDAREAGFDNISLDLMLGIPSQTLDSLKQSVNELLTFAPEHISIYSLQLEEGTPLYRMQERYDIADEDTAADMYEIVVNMMREAGYSHYEISNFAREGKESRHNCKYWRLDEYLGFGLSAHSDFGGKRIENTKNMADYLSGKYVLNEQDISLAEREFEFLMLGFRTAKGVSRSEYKARFGKELDLFYGEKLEKLSKMGYLEEKSDTVSLSERGFEVSNAILSELLDFDY